MSLESLEEEIVRLEAAGKKLHQVEYETGTDMPPPGLAAAFHDTLDGHAVGYSWAIARAGELQASGGFGYAIAPWEASLPTVNMGYGSRLHLASASKPFTAVAVLNALESHLGYDLDTPFLDVIGHLFTNEASGLDQVTIRDLLQHKSGMQPDQHCGNADDTDMLAILQTAVSRPMVRARGGATAHYSNQNYCLLRLVVEEIANTDYVTYVQQQVLAPMGITGPSCTPNMHPTSQMPNYALDQTSGAGWFNLTDYAGYCGAYGWHAGADDVASLFAGLRSNTVLNQTSRNAMFSELLGVWEYPTNGGTARGHNGGWTSGGQGLSTIVMQLPDGIDAALLINTDGLSADWTLVDGYNRMRTYQ
jgi:CubicO group peptidase (beta-lactamase class C family)